MADWLEVFAALAEDPDSDSSTTLCSSQLPGSHSKQCLCPTPSFGLLGALHLHMHKMKSLQTVCLSFEDKGGLEMVLNSLLKSRLLPAFVFPVGFGLHKYPGGNVPTLSG